jgi:hypothetical protein
MTVSIHQAIPPPKKPVRLFSQKKIVSNTVRIKSQDNTNKNSKLLLRKIKLINIIKKILIMTAKILAISLSLQIKWEDKPQLSKWTLKILLN